MNLEEVMLRTGILLQNQQNTNQIVDMVINISKKLFLSETRHDCVD